MNIGSSIHRLLSLGFALLVTAFAITVPTMSTANELFISEYVEGSFFNQAIEVYNPTGGSVDLDGDNYVLLIYVNGNASLPFTVYLTGTVASDATHVLTHSSAELTLFNRADQRSPELNFNGDDAIALVRDGVVLDVIGQIGFDPGFQWGSGNTSTQDNTLVRKPEVCRGDVNGSDPFDPTLEWNGFARETYSNLGWHSYSCRKVDVPSASTTPSLSLIETCRPNPMFSSSMIRYRIAPEDAGRISLAIFDIGGRRVRELMNAEVPAGTYQEAWDGRSDSGERVSDGLYVCRLSAGGRMFTRKLTLLFGK